MFAAIAAGAYSGLQAFIDAAMFATVVFAPAGLPLDVGIQHALLGSVITQTAVTYFTGADALLSPGSYEVMPFLGRFASGVAAALKAERASDAAALPTVLAGSMIINLIAAVLFALLSALPLGDAVTAALPAPMQAGIFAAIGWSLYGLSYETLGLAEPAALFITGDAFDYSAYRLWLPATILGLGLWHASRVTSHPALFPAFALGLTGATHAIRIAAGATTDEARADGWLMATMEARPCWTLWAARSFSDVRFDLIFSADALGELGAAALFGPIINTVLNLALLTPVIGKALETSTELRAHSIGTFGAALGGGYSSYLAVSNTAVHIKCGGTNRASCYAAAAAAALFFVAHRLFFVRRDLAEIQTRATTRAHSHAHTFTRWSAMCPRCSCPRRAHSSASTSFGTASARK